MSIFDFLAAPLADDNQALTRDVKVLVQDLQKARPPDLPRLTAEAQAALADEQALTAEARGLVQDLSLFPASEHAVLGAELERILSDGQALADALQAFIHDPPSERAALHQLATTLAQDDQSVARDLKTFDQDMHDTRITDPHQTLAAAVDLLGHKIEAFAQDTPPPEP